MTKYGCLAAYASPEERQQDEAWERHQDEHGLIHDPECVHCQENEPR